MHNSHGVCLGFLWYQRSVLGVANLQMQIEIKTIGVLPIRITKSNVLSIDSKR